jgi:hypothetical protein
VNASPDFITLLCALSYVLFAIYSFALWTFALLRTRLNFCYIFMATAVFSFIISVITVILYWDPYFGLRTFGHAGWRICYYFIVLIQPAASLVSAAGTTVLVVWLVKRSNQAMQSTRES